MLPGEEEEQDRSRREAPGMIAYTEPYMTGPPNGYADHYRGPIAILRSQLGGNRIDRTRGRDR